MSYRPWLEERALRQMGNLPAEALDALVHISHRPGSIHWRRCMVAITSAGAISRR